MNHLERLAYYMLCCEESPQDIRYALWEKCKDYTLVDKAIDYAKQELREQENLQDFRVVRDIERGGSGDFS